MTDHLLHARLFNKGGELIAEGPCWVDEANGRATLEPEHAPGFIQKERGELSLKLDSGRSLAVSDNPMILKLGVTPNGDAINEHRSIYRLRLLDSEAGTSTDAQEANVAGAVAEGSTTPPQVGLQSNGETPAPR
jgi:hypothetical protein